MTRRFEFETKAAVPYPPAPAADPSQADDAVEEVEQHEWAGDLHQGGDQDVSDPAQAFAAFTGQEGEAAWLDRADDGTLTGWVRDADGSVYRYSDADAWAVDVDDAGMSRSDGADAQADPAAEGQDPAAAGGAPPAPGQDPAEAGPSGVAAPAEPPTEGDPDVDEDAVAALLADPAAISAAAQDDGDEDLATVPAGEDEDLSGDDPADEEDDSEEDPDAEDDESEDPEDPEDEEEWKKKLEGKSFPVPRSGTRLVVRRRR